MGKRLAAIKNILHRISVSFKLDGIRSEIKRYFKEESPSGEIIDVLKETSKFWNSCPAGFPSEYCSYSNSEHIYVVRTFSGEIYTIMQGEYGFIWDGPSQKSTFSVTNAQGEEVFSSEIVAQRKLINKQTENENK